LKCTGDCKQTFQESLISPLVLAHDPKRLAGDVSAYGMGAVIAHVYQDGTEHPIAYASKTFTASELNYAKLEREAYLLVYDVWKLTSTCMGVSSLCAQTTSPSLPISG